MKVLISVLYIMRVLEILNYYLSTFWIIFIFCYAVYLCIMHKLVSVSVLKSLRQRALLQCTVEIKNKSILLLLIDTGC